MAASKGFNKVKIVNCDNKIRHFWLSEEEADFLTDIAREQNFWNHKEKDNEIYQM